jgi:hypothetical protein
VTRIELDHVQIAAPEGCEDEARRYFGELLGLPEIDKPEPLLAGGGAWFALGRGLADDLGRRAPGRASLLL